MTLALPDWLVDDPRWFILSNVVLWVAIGTTIGTVSFDQGILRSAIPAVFGGLASGVVLFSATRERRQ
jgi:hypothetical protein